MKSVWTIIVTVVLTALVVGAGTYYVINQKAQKEQDVLQSQIDDLKNKISSQQSSNNTSDIANSTNNSTAGNTTTTTPAKTPKQVVDEFWTGYIDVDTVMETYLRSTTLLTAELKNRLMTDNNGVEGRNAVTCAQDTPPSFTSVLNSNTANTAALTVTENFSEPVQVAVGLTLSDNNWLISSITCPAI